MTLTGTVEWTMCARSETNGCPVAVVIRVVVVCVVARCVGKTSRRHPDERIVVPHLKRLGTLLCTCANVRATGSGIRGNLFFMACPYLWAHIKDWHVPRRFEYRKRVTTGVVEYTAATFA